MPTPDDELSENMAQSLLKMSLFYILLCWSWLNSGRVGIHIHIIAGHYDILQDQRKFLQFFSAEQSREPFSANQPDKFSL